MESGIGGRSQAVRHRWIMLTGLAAMEPGLGRRSQREHRLRVGRDRDRAAMESDRWRPE
jgi:hypothetical protein